MAKRTKRRQRKARGTPPRPKQDLGMREIPSAQTLFCADLQDPQIEALLTQLSMRVKPELRERDAARVAQVERATTVEAVLDLLPIATGMAEPAWQGRMQQFGPEAVSPIVVRLRDTRDIQDEMAKKRRRKRKTSVKRDS
jgi:hypothetical protein